jgi:hypothetical protein
MHVVNSHSKNDNLPTPEPVRLYEYIKHNNQITFVKIANFCCDFATSRVTVATLPILIMPTCEEVGKAYCYYLTILKVLLSGVQAPATQCLGTSTTVYAATPVLQSYLATKIAANLMAASAAAPPSHYLS